MNHQNVRYYPVKNKAMARRRKWRRFKRKLGREIASTSRRIDAFLMYCTGIVPGSRHLYPEIAMRYRPKSVWIIIPSLINGVAWGYAALFSFGSWWVALLTGAVITIGVLHLDMFLVSQIGMAEPRSSEETHSSGSFPANVPDHDAGEP